MQMTTQILKLFIEGKNPLSSRGSVGLSILQNVSALKLARLINYLIKCRKF